MIRGLRVNGTEQKAKVREQELRAWIAAEPKREAQFGSALDDLIEHLKGHPARGAIEICCWAT